MTSMQSIKNIMKLITENIPVYIILNDFLRFKDIINLSMVSKLLHRHKYKNNSIKNRSSYIIFNFIKRVRFNKIIYNSLYDNNLFTSKIVASYYFMMYPKIYINSWYNMGQGWKKDTIDSYNPTRLDLFILIKNMKIGDTFAIGW